MCDAASQVAYALELLGPARNLSLFFYLILRLDLAGYINNDTLKEELTAFCGRAALVIQPANLSVTCCNFVTMRDRIPINNTLFNY